MLRGSVVDLGHAREAVMDVAVPQVEIACPRCGVLHLDLGVWATRVHRRHLCVVCGLVWVVEPEVFGALEWTQATPSKVVRGSPQTCRVCRRVIPVGPCTRLKRKSNGEGGYPGGIYARTHVRCGPLSQSGDVQVVEPGVTWTETPTIRPAGIEGGLVGVPRVVAPVSVGIPSAEQVGKHTIQAPRRFVPGSGGRNWLTGRPE